MYKCTQALQRKIEKEKYEDQKKKRLETKRKSFIRDRSVDLKSEPNPNLIIKNELNKQSTTINLKTSHTDLPKAADTDKILVN